jgi:mitochondrial splicing suppressor protein 51
MRFTARSTARFVAAIRPRHVPHSLTGNRQLFNLLRKSNPQLDYKPQDPILAHDNLFHPFSKSPFPAVHARGEAVQLLAPCPVCASSNQQAQPRAVKFECPQCGWPTHCSEEHYHEDKEHQKYCSRLREANEDEHDLRSGRRLREFELPGLSTLHLPSRSSQMKLSPDRASGIRGSHFVC